MRLAPMDAFRIAWFLRMCTWWATPSAAPPETSMPQGRFPRRHRLHHPSVSFAAQTGIGPRPGQLTFRRHLMDRTIATRSLAAAFVVGAIAQALLVGAELGINIPLVVAATMASAVFLSNGGRRIDRLDLWLPVAAVAVSAMVAIRSDSTLLFLDVVTAASLLGASMAAFAGAAVTRRSALAIVATGTVVLAWVGGGILRMSVAARRPAATGPGWRARMPAWAGPVARGLLLALPVLLLFVALFSSADAIFASIAADVFGWEFDLGELPVRLGVAFLVAWVVAGLLGVAAGAAELRLAQGAPPDAVAGRRRSRTPAARSAPRRDRSPDDPRRGRSPVRCLRQPPGRLPVRWPGHARSRRDHLRQLRAARLLRARHRDLPRRRPGRRPPRDRCRANPGVRRRRRRGGAPDVRHPCLRGAPSQPLPGRVWLDRAPLLHRRNNRVARAGDRRRDRPPRPKPNALAGPRDDRFRGRDPRSSPT